MNGDRWGSSRMLFRPQLESDSIKLSSNPRNEGSVMADADKYGPDTGWSKTVVTIDEAVGMLLGMLNGPVQYRCRHDNPTAEEEEILDGLEFSLVEQLNDDVERAESALAEAKHDGQPNEVLDAKRATVAEAKAWIPKARTFFCAIEDELSRGESSALRTDKSRSSTASVHLTISSLDEWARTRYGISFLSRDAAVDAGHKRQEPPNAAVKTDVDATQKRKPRTRQLEQGQAILAEIRRLGHDPKRFPKHGSREPGVKSKVRDALENNPLFTAPTSFEKAWERLRKSQDIADAEGPPPPKKSMGETCGGG